MVAEVRIQGSKKGHLYYLVHGAIVDNALRESQSEQ